MEFSPSVQNFCRSRYDDIENLRRQMLDRLSLYEQGYLQPAQVFQEFNAILQVACNQYDAEESSGALGPPPEMPTETFAAFSRDFDNNVMLEHLIHLYGSDFLRRENNLISRGERSRRLGSPEDARIEPIDNVNGYMAIPINEDVYNFLTNLSVDTPMESLHNVKYGNNAQAQPLMDFPIRLNGIDPQVMIGSYGTRLPAAIYDRINWSAPQEATRELLVHLFGIDVLATHTLSGRPSPAFHGRPRPVKQQLDANVVADIIHCVTKLTKCTERDVRATITTKCADAAKRVRRISAPKKQQDEENQQSEMEELNSSVGSQPEMNRSIIIKKEGVEEKPRSGVLHLPIMIKREPMLGE